MLKRFFEATTWLSVILLGAGAYANRINVPADYATIQGAIYAASNADSVIVADGMYFENVVIKNKSIVLASMYAIDSDNYHILNTIINGSAPIHADTGSCVIVHGSGANGTIIQGFTLTGGNGTNWFDISDSKTYREGGGILVEANNVIIKDNIIAGNTATQTGAGITSAGGGGVRVGFGSAEFYNNVISSNQGKYGSGVVAFHSSIIFRNNFVYGNTLANAFGGGGLWIWSGGSSSTIENNTIINNSSALSGGGISLNGVTVDMVNNIIYGNTAPNGPQIIASSSSVNISYTDIQGGFAGIGNINADPLLESLNNFTLSLSSPCIDSGDPSPAYDDPEDIPSSGLAKYPARGTIRSDMGANGGPGCRLSPIFTVPLVSFVDSIADFDTVRIGASDTAAVSFKKSGFGNVTFSSISYVSHPPHNFSTVSTIPTVWGAARRDTLLIIWQPLAIGEMTDTALIYHNDPSVASPLVVELRGFAEGQCGDADGSNAVDISDVVFLISYIFGGGPAPNPLLLGDADCSGNVDISDAVYLISYIFAGGPAPCETCK